MISGEIGRVKYCATMLARECLPNIKRETYSAMQYQPYDLDLIIYQLTYMNELIDAPVNDILKKERKRLTGVDYPKEFMPTPFDSHLMGIQVNQTNSVP